ncbi:MAG: F0F1 ATP synthase subunit B [bacterium]|nr:F0F1 ATP synthase subunit B [bacterium]
MGETLKEFGIQWPLLVASILNFLILLFLLKKFLYQPILKVLDERKEIIAKSIENAEAIENERVEMEARVKSSLRLANSEAAKIINQAHKTAEKAKDEIMDTAHRQAEKMLERAKSEIAQERQDTVKAIRKETAGLISNALRKIVGKSQLTDEDKIIKETLETIDG